MEELFLLANVNFYPWCVRPEIDNGGAWTPRLWQHNCKYPINADKILRLFDKDMLFLKIPQTFKCRDL